MATFLATQDMRVQQHFEVLEIDLPVITGACTIGATQGTGTPLSCDQKWAIADGGLSEYKTYYFTNENAPILPSINGEPVWRCIKSISETATELKPGDGLSSRSSLSIVFNDFDKQDPNMGAPGVTDIVKNQGTYFGKLDARQIIENKSVRLKLYRVEQNGSVDLVNGAQTRNYLADTLSLNKNGSWNLACKDVLSLVNLGEKSWPITQGGFVRLDVDNGVNVIPVDTVVDYSNVDFIRIGDEFLQVVSFDTTDPAAPFLNVTTRGGDLYAPISGVLLTVTNASDHDAGDEVFICDLSDNETIDGLLTRILVESDFPIALIPAADWAAEVLEWHSTDKINTLHSESEDVNDVINRILTGYLMDLWFSVTDNEAKLSAISVWKQSTATLTEGKEVNAYSIKKTAKESLRATRALVLYDKRNLSDSDDATSFKKGAQQSDNDIISPALFTKHKDKLFDNNFLLDTDAAKLLTQRYVSRFKFTPFERSWVTDERYLTFKTGDVVDLQTTADQGIYGGQSGNIRGQITKINPKYKDGRTYEVKAITYEAAALSGTTYIIDEPVGGIEPFDLYGHAGNPPEAVDLVFVFKGSYSSSINGGTAIRAGDFKPDSTLTIILTDGFDGQAAGGIGGRGGSVTEVCYPGEGCETFTGNPENGENGGIVYDAQGVTTDIYFSGTTSSTAYPIANGSMRAPGGGAGGFHASLSVSGDGGNGGDGRNAGQGGLAGSASGSGKTTGVAGANGQIDGSGSGFGVVGVNNDATGGLAGSAIKTGSATVKLHGSSAARYIAGNGDAVTIV